MIQFRIFRIFRTLIGGYFLVVVLSYLTGFFGCLGYLGQAEYYYLSILCALCVYQVLKRLRKNSDYNMAQLSYDPDRIPRNDTSDINSEGYCLQSCRTRK